MGLGLTTTKTLPPQHPLRWHAGAHTTCLMAPAMVKILALPRHGDAPLRLCPLATIRFAGLGVLKCLQTSTNMQTSAYSRPHHDSNIVYETTIKPAKLSHKLKDHIRNLKQIGHYSLELNSERITSSHNNHTIYRQ